MSGGCTSFAILARILDDEDTDGWIKDIMYFLKVIYCFLISMHAIYMCEIVVLAGQSPFSSRNFLSIKIYKVV